MSRNKKITIAVIALLALLVGMVCAWYFGYHLPREKERDARGENAITITVEVAHSDGTTKTFTLNTTATYLADALLEANLMEAHEDTYGLYVDAMDGETASAENRAAWCFDVDGTMGETGVSQTILQEGSVYAFYIVTW